jgi:hypothetical protein
MDDVTEAVSWNYLQTRFGCPVPTQRVTNRTIVLKMVRVPRMSVTIRPVEAWSTPWIRKVIGIA